MKSYSAIAVLTMTAALIPANASTTLYTTNPMQGTNPQSICLQTTQGVSTCSGAVANAYFQATAAYTNGLTIPSGQNASYTGIMTLGGGTATPGLSNGQLGISTISPLDNIGPYDYVVVDFSSNINATGTNPVKFTFQETNKEQVAGGSYMVVYGINSNGTGTELWHTEMTASLLTQPVTTSALAYYSSYAIGILGDCDFTIVGAQIDYSSITPKTGVPEPGTFVMAGAALLGLGVAMKKRRSRA